MLVIGGSGPDGETAPKLAKATGPYLAVLDEEQGTTGKTVFGQYGAPSGQWFLVDRESTVIDSGEAPDTAFPELSRLTGKPAPEPVPLDFGDLGPMAGMDSSMPGMPGDFVEETPDEPLAGDASEAEDTADPEPEESGGGADGDAEPADNNGRPAEAN